MAASPRPQRLRAAGPRSRRSSNCCSVTMARRSPSLLPPLAGCRTQRGQRSPVCASAATPSGLIGPTRREDRSIGSTRRRSGTIAPHRTLRRRRLAKRRRIDPSPPRGREPVGRRDGEAARREPRHDLRSYRAATLDLGIDHLHDRTIGPRIRISRPDGGSARCNASRARAQPRSSSQRTPPSTTLSTANAISRQLNLTACYAPRR